MGTSSAGIAIKTNTENLDLNQTLSDLLRKQIIQSDKYCDIRKTGCFYLSTYDNYLIIYNLDLVNEIYENEQSVILTRINEYFDNPNSIFVFEHYDSGDTYSYAIFENGEIIRKFRYHNENVLIDEGNLLEVEIKWKNARTEIEYDDDDDELEFLIYFNPDDETESYIEEDLPCVILHELMAQKLGFDMIYDDVKETSSGYFMLV